MKPFPRIPAIIITVLIVMASTCSAKDRSIHVYVALADNKNQGIVPVPERLGNGDDTTNNLYWGAMYGVKSWFKRSADWSLISSKKDLSDNVLERCVFRHKRSHVYLVADAYRGPEIKSCISNFLSAAAGDNGSNINVSTNSIETNGNADLVVYAGHNGLMDFNVRTPVYRKDSGNRDAMILACKSSPYFGPLLHKLRCVPLLLTTGFMAPEAYTLDAALSAWINNKSPADIRKAAARAYNKYQKCGIAGAMRLFGVKD